MLQKTINPSIEKTIKDNLKTQLENITSQLQKHDSLILELKSTIADLQKRVDTLKGSTSSSFYLTPGSENFESFVHELADRQRRASSIVLLNFDKTRGKNKKNNIDWEKK